MDADWFEAATVGRARWPEPPSHWSYSSLKEAEECPRRWALSRAEYPEVWSRSGYPPKPAMAAIAGEVVHRSLQYVLLALHQRQAGQDNTGVDALRRLGGYSALVRRVVAEYLAELGSNPRMAPRLESIRTSLSQRLPEIRHKVQKVVARMGFSTASPLMASDAGRGRGALPPGTFPEVDLRATDIRFVGRADLLSVTEDAVTITDYKTGDTNPEHIDQLRVYALLWMHDSDLNPSGRAATTLVIAYPSADERYDGPDRSDLAQLRSALTDRIEAAEREIALRPPPAKPGLETCRYCQVKHLCEEYWPFLTPKAGDASDVDGVRFIDLEGAILRQNGPRSYVIVDSYLSGEVLLRTPTESPPFGPGDRVRLVGVVYSEDDDAEQRVITVTRASEIFLVET